jgi:hypothetical protein
MQSFSAGPLCEVANARLSTATMATPCTALGLTLVVRAATAAELPPIPEQAWRAAELMERPTRVAVLPLAPGVHRLALGRFGDFAVDLVANTVDVYRLPEAGIALAEVLEGPVLLHALATRGIHALHASALQLPDGRVYAFTADSGTGKSSLAAHAHARGWIRVADDLLALTLDRGRIVALPGLHQPKLSVAEQPGARLPERLALAGLFRLQRTPGSACLHALGTSAACTLLLQATVATRVYAPASLAAHLGFAARFAEAVRDGGLQVATLDLPDRPADVAGALDEVLALLQG